MDLRLFYFIGGFVVVLLLLLVSFVLSARRVSRIESVLDEIQERLHLDSDDRPISSGTGLGSTDTAVDSSQIIVRNAKGEEQSLDEVLDDLNAKLDAASREQQKSYANIMAEQQNLKEYLGQLKTLLAGISTASGVKGQGEGALSGVANTMAASVVDGPSGTLSAVANDLAVKSNNLNGAGVSAGAAFAAVGRQAERSLSPAAVMAMASAQQSNAGNNLRGVASEPSYIDERLRAEFGDDNVMSAPNQQGAQASYGDSERQADLAFAAVKQHKYQDQVNNGVYLPPRAVPLAAAEGAFMPNADTRAMTQRASRGSAQEYVSSHFEPASANNGEAYGSNHGGYNGGQGSNINLNASQGQNFGVNGRDPRNPLGMGSRGVSSPKDNGANAEDEPSVSAYNSEEHLNSISNSDFAKSFASELATVNTDADITDDAEAIYAFNDLKAKALSTSAQDSLVESCDGAKSKTKLSAAMSTADNAELTSEVLSPEEAWDAVSNGKSDKLNLDNSKAKPWDEAAQIEQALIAAEADKHELSLDIPSLVKSGDFIPVNAAADTDASFAERNEVNESYGDQEATEISASTDSVSIADRHQLEDDQTIEMEIEPRGSLFHSLFQAEAFAQNHVQPVATSNSSVIVSGLDLVSGISTLVSATQGATSTAAQGAAADQSAVQGTIATVASKALEDQSNVAALEVESAQEHEDIRDRSLSLQDGNEELYLKSVASTKTVGSDAALMLDRESSGNDEAKLQIITCATVVSNGAVNADQHEHGINGSEKLNDLEISAEGGRDADRAFTSLNAPEAEHLVESLEMGTIDVAPSAITMPTAIPVLLPSAEGESGINSEEGVDRISTGISSNLHVEDDDDAERFDALRALTSNYQQLQQPLGLKVDSGAGETENSAAVKSVSAIANTDAFALEIEPVTAEASLGAGAVNSANREFVDDDHTNSAVHGGEAVNSVADSESPRSLIVDFTNYAPGEFKVKLAKAEQDDAKALSSEVGSKEESERDAYAVAFKAEDFKSDVVAAAIAAQITASPEQARGVQAVGVGAFKQNGIALEADAANANESKSLVVDLFYDDEVYRKHQREKPNGIDFRILDKAHRFLEAGVSLQELSQCTGLSEDELRMLYDVDENDQIKDKDANALVEHIYHENEEAVAAARAAGAFDDVDDENAIQSNARHVEAKSAIDVNGSTDEEDYDNVANDEAVDADLAKDESIESSVSEDKRELEPKHEAQELAAAIAEGMEGKKRRKHKNGKNGKNSKKRKRQIVDDKPATALDPAEQKEIAAMMQQKEDPFAITNVFESRQATAREAQLSESDEANDTKIVEVNVRNVSAQSEVIQVASDPEFVKPDFEVEHEADHLAEVTAAARQRQQSDESKLAVPEGVAATFTAVTSLKGATAMDADISNSTNVNTSINTNANVNANTNASGTVAEPELLEAEPINNNKHKLRVRAGVQSYAQVSQPIGLGSVDEEENDIETANAAYQHLTAEADSRYAQGNNNAPLNNVMLPAHRGNTEEDNNPYMQQMMAGIVEAIDREEDSVTIAGISTTAMPKASHAAATANAVASGMAASAITPPSSQPPRTHSSASVQKALEPMSIGGIERVQSHDVVALSNDEELKFSRARANAKAHDRSVQVSAAAQAGDPKALMAGRKRQSTGSGLFSMLSTPLNVAQNLAAQATAALRGAKGASADSVNSAAYSDGAANSRGREAERGDHVTLSAAARAAASASPELSKGTNIANASSNASPKVEVEKKSLAYHKRDSGLIEVPVPLETMAAGKMTVDMALAQIEHGSKVKLEDDDLELTSDSATDSDLMSALDDKASAQMSAAERLLGMNARQGGQVGETIDAASFGNMREELAYQDLMASAESSSIAGVAAGMEAQGGEQLEQGEQTLTPEQLETLKKLQNGVMAAMNNPVLSRPNNQYMPLQNKAQNKRAREAAAAVFGTEPPRHFANLQARNAYNLRQ